MKNFQTILNESQKQFTDLFQSAQDYKDGVFKLTDVKLVSNKNLIAAWRQTVKVGKHNFIIGEENDENNVSTCFICYLGSVNDWNKMDNGYSEWFSFAEDEEDLSDHLISWLDEDNFTENQDIKDAYVFLSEEFFTILSKFKLPKK